MFVHNSPPITHLNGSRSEITSWVLNATSPSTHFWTQQANRYMILAWDNVAVTREAAELEVPRIAVLRA
jgi:hypothetical protein